jgi:RNA polymerase sigma-70 factor (ECF subfamily)
MMQEPASSGVFARSVILDAPPVVTRMRRNNCRVVRATAHESAAPHETEENVGSDAKQPSQGELTQYLIDLSAGAADGDSPLLGFVYDELKAIAAAYVRPGIGPGDSLPATALVHDAYLKLFDHDRLDLKNRGHFFALAAKAMRQLLVDHARHRGRKKRGGDRSRQPLDDALAAVEAMNVDVLDLEEALSELGELDPQQAKVVEMRFFVGLGMEEIGEALGFSRATAEREWYSARAWLGHRLGKGYA